jgi:hypothetical protein
LDQALADGCIRVYCLGLTPDALALAGDLVTVAVFEPELYDALFGIHVDRNDEGAPSLPAPSASKPTRSGLCVSPASCPQER